MKNWAIVLCVLASVGAAEAGWLWPFGSHDEDEGPRLSELMEPASLLIDDAADLAADGKYHESVEKYREALDELSRIENDYPDRAAKMEFASLRNKRAYVNAAIDSLLLAEAQSNAKPVSITDTTELEKKFLRRRGLLPPEEVKPPARVTPSKAEPPSRPAVAELLAEDPVKNRRRCLKQIGESVGAGRYDEAMRDVGELLKANPNDVSALNLKAVCEASQGDFTAAEQTLDHVLEIAPRDYHGFYNMANLKLRNGGQKVAARYYYETGLAVGGPKNAALEAAVKE